MASLADRVSTYLRGKGYPLVSAYLPAQDVTDGRIEIAIVEGRIQQGANGIVLRPDSAVRMSQSRLRAIAEAAVDPGQPARQRDLERAVLLINDLPGVAARGALERGDEPGYESRVRSARVAHEQRLRSRVRSGKDSRRREDW